MTGMGSGWGIGVLEGPTATPSLGLPPGQTMGSAQTPPQRVRLNQMGGTGHRSPPRTSRPTVPAPTHTPGARGGDVPTRCTTGPPKTDIGCPARTCPARPVDAYAYANARPIGTQALTRGRRERRPAPYAAQRTTKTRGMPHRHRPPEAANPTG
uniref:Uncharacterized protein n=1 Tax=Eutreptiella gymnastica TaxID=73025 RepID=A0A7S1IBV1_9EUGL